MAAAHHVRKSHVVQRAHVQPVEPAWWRGLTGRGGQLAATATAVGGAACASSAAAPVAAVLQGRHASTCACSYTSIISSSELATPSLTRPCAVLAGSSFACCCCCCCCTAAAGDTWGRHDSGNAVWNTRLLRLLAIARLVARFMGLPCSCRSASSSTSNSCTSALQGTAEGAQRRVAHACNARVKEK